MWQETAKQLDQVHVLLISMTNATGSSTKYHICFGVCVNLCVSKYMYVLSTFYKNNMGNWKKLI